MVVYLFYPGSYTSAG